MMCIFQMVIDREFSEPASEMFVGKSELMQTEGGYRYPSNRILLILSIFSALVTAAVWYDKCLPLFKSISLFLGLEGTSLLASAYSPVGLEPPQGSLWSKIKWVFNPSKKGITTSFNQGMFYGGLLCLFSSYIVGVLAA